MTKLITLPNVYDNPQITYYDWDLSFKNTTLASRPDNFGKDEIQLIFNMNQNIEWKIGSDENDYCPEYQLVKISSVREALNNQIS